MCALFRSISWLNFNTKKQQKQQIYEKSSLLLSERRVIAEADKRWAFSKETHVTIQYTNSSSSYNKNYHNNNSKAKTATTKQLVQRSDCIQSVWNGSIFISNGFSQKKMRRFWSYMFFCAFVCRSVSTSAYQYTHCVDKSAVYSSVRNKIKSNEITLHSE